MATEYLIVHASYIDYSSTVIEDSSLHIDHICTSFPEDMTRYPDGTLQLKSSAKWYYSSNVIDPIRNALTKKAETKYPIKPGETWTTGQMSKMYKENIFEDRSISYKGIKDLTDDQFVLYYHGKWTRQHLMSFPQNDVAFTGSLPYGHVSVTVLFRDLVTSGIMRAFEEMVKQWTESMNDQTLFGAGHVGICADAAEINPLIVDVLKGRSAEVCLDVSKSSQNAINWLIISIISFCQQAVINQIRYKALHIAIRYLVAGGMYGGTEKGLLDESCPQRIPFDISQYGQQMLTGDDRKRFEPSLVDLAYARFGNLAKDLCYDGAKIGGMPLTQGASGDASPS